MVATETGIRRRDLFVAMLFVSAVFVLGVKLLNPTPIQIIVGENEAVVAQIPGFFTYTDVTIILASSLSLGFTGAREKGWGTSFGGEKEDVERNS